MTDLEMNRFIPLCSHRYSFGSFFVTRQDKIRRHRRHAWNESERERKRERKREREREGRGDGKRGNVETVFLMRIARMCTDSIFVQVTSAVERWSEGESFSRGVNTRAPTIRLIIYWSGEGEFPFTVCLSLPCHCECACHAYVCVHRLDEDPATSPLVPNFLNKSQNRKLRHLRGSLNVARPRRDYRSNFFPLYVRLPVLRLSKQ